MNEWIKQKNKYSQISKVAETAAEICFNTFLKCL